MQYNSTRKSLIIPEYGRSVQQMVDHCKAIEDREKRNAFANAIVDVLGNMNTHLRDVPEFQHKLWDQLFIMAEFDLDVDSPYPIPSEKEIKKPPRKIPYPKVSNSFRYYGNNIKKAIELAKKIPEADKKEDFAFGIANHMKRTYITWNKDQVTDLTIFEQLKKISNDEIDLTQAKGDLISGNEIRSQIVTVAKSKPRKKGGKR